MGTERYDRWEPIAGLAEQPVSHLVARFDGENLAVKGPYTFGPESSWIEITFDYAEAFKFYEEFSDPWMESGVDLPRVEGGRWTWPLLEVIDSEWIARIVERNAGLRADDGWRHLTVTSLNFSVHVMTKRDPLAVRLTAGEPSWR